jgi:hypothetical protein
MIAEPTEASAVHDRLMERLLKDELVEALLLLHGLHPQSLEERIERALLELRPRLSGRIEKLRLFGKIEIESPDAGLVQLGGLRTTESG